MKNIYYNGKIVTMEQDALYAEAAAVCNGKILCVGTRESVEKKCGEGWNMIDLQGHTMLPGFIDSHSHFSGMAIAFTQIDLAGTDSYEKVKDKTDRFLKEFHPEEGGFVLARNFEPYRADIRDNFTMRELDELAPGYGVVIQHKSGHMGWMNSRALAFLKISDDIENPPGGYIGKMDGKLTGYLEESAFVDNLKKIPFYNPEQMEHAVKMAQERYASYGITTVQEGFVLKELEGPLSAIVDSGNLKLDYVWYTAMEEWETLREMYPNAIRKYDGHLKIAGCKTFLDGSPQAKTAWLSRPYEGTDERGYPAMKDEQFEKICTFCMENGVQLLAHCNGDAACQQYIEVYGKVFRKYLKDIRPVMIHAQLLRKDQLEEVKKYHMIPSFFVSHVYHWGEVHVKNLGWERAKSISPLRSAKEMGIPFTIHTDAPVIEPDLLEAVWCSVNRMIKNGTQLGSEECVKVFDALCAVTKNAAYQYGEEAEKGTIAEGKRADLVILDENPLTVKKERIRKIQVLETIKDGETVFKKTAEK